MVALRATQKVLRHLPAPGPEPGPPDTALGDWFVNRLVVDRRPLLLLVSSTSLLAILEPARDVRGLPERLEPLVALRLFRLGVPPGWIEAEVAALAPVAVAKTNSRSVLGTMNDFAHLIPYMLPVDGWGDATLRDAEARLAHTPCRSSAAIAKGFFPDILAAQRLGERWGSPGPGRS